jgi:glutathione S-transferase
LRLFYARGTCSLSPHIVVRELDLPCELERVDLKTKRTENGADFLVVNPKGQVPTLQLDDGTVLTEGAVIVQYLADLRPEAGLIPLPGRIERYRLQEWLNYIASEVHKAFSTLFADDLPDEWKQATLKKIDRKLQYVSSQLVGQYLLGDGFTVPDAYLFTVLQWSRLFRIDLGRFPPLKAYVQRIAARPAVQAAIAEERQRAD